MPNAWEVRIDPSGPLDGALATQEALLGRGGLAVHVAAVQTTVLSYGVGISADAPFVRHAEALGVRAVRRSSGGAGVVHLAGDLVWGVVLPRTDPRVGRDFVRAAPRFGAGLIRALAARGLRSTWVPAPGLSEDCCPLGRLGHVLEVGGGIVAAVAQHVNRQALLHQGTLSRSVDRALLTELFAFVDPSVADRLTGVRECGVEAPAAELAGEVAAGLVAALDAR
ncbi:MAG: hypothetical protein L3K10_00115 [Thermoplasmata archaeon]|nr:hypothetical protein [Thermoplasmata archaeon]